MLSQQTHPAHPNHPSHPSHTTHAITLRVNGVEHALALEPRHTLLDTLRYDLALTGTKKVCDMGDCGACTVLLDGKAVYSCLTLAVDCDGQEVTTVEGLVRGGRVRRSTRCSAPLSSATPSSAASARRARL